MPPQGLNLKEYGTGSGGTAPQAQNFEFLSHKIVKISLFFFYYLLTRRQAHFLGEGQMIPMKYSGAPLYDGAHPAHGIIFVNF